VKCRVGRESCELRLLCQTSDEGVESFGDRVVSVNNKWSPRREEKRKVMKLNSSMQSQAAESNLEYPQAVEIGLTRSQALVRFRNFLLLVGKFTVREKEGN
jgi:hypothetical protein